MRWYILGQLAKVFTVLILLCSILITILGSLRFFLLTGASPRYVFERKRWFEKSILGRKMTKNDFKAFIDWHARISVSYTHLTLPTKA